MCLPMAVAAAGMAAAGSLVGGYSALQQGNYQARVAKENARLANEQGRDAALRGKDSLLRFYREVGQVKGRQIAAMAANGIDVGYGTAARLQEDTGMLAREDAERLHKNIDDEIRGFDISASNFIAEGRAAKSRGRAAMIGSVFEAGSSLMGGFQQQKRFRAQLGLSGKG